MVVQYQCRYMATRLYESRLHRAGYIQIMRLTFNHLVGYYHHLAIPNDTNWLSFIFLLFPIDDFLCLQTYACIDFCHSVPLLPWVPVPMLVSSGCWMQARSERKRKTKNKTNNVESMVVVNVDVLLAETFRWKIYVYIHSQISRDVAVV